MERLLSDFADTVLIQEWRGSHDVRVADLAYDSRKVNPGSLFFALSGGHVDGRAFIGKAIESGAVCIVHSKLLDYYHEGIAYLRVHDPRLAMSPIASAFYGNPSRSMGIIGITGTEGKSTTAYLVYQLLEAIGEKTGFISTVQYALAQEPAWNPEHQTTPEATTIHRFLAEMRSFGKRWAVVESSSHGLSPRTNRLGDVAFDIGVCTNVTHEHLEFHGTWEQYRADKGNLLRVLDTVNHHKVIDNVASTVPSFSVMNADDPSCAYFSQLSRKPFRTFSAHGMDADLRALDICEDAHGFFLTIIERDTKRHSARAELPGTFNVNNVLAALLTVSEASGRPISDFIPLLPMLKPVRGRMTRLECNQAFEVLVDYAHTPSSFEAVLLPLRKRARGKIICVFGSGGERDIEKRPLQGKIASTYCDIVILADEDPRGEDPVTLLEMIAAGCSEKKKGESLFIIPDRPQAIRHALSLARDDDIVLLLGKGHENSIIYKTGPIPYDEIAETEKALAELDFSRKGKHP